MKSLDLYKQIAPEYRLGVDDKNRTVKLKKKDIIALIDDLLELDRKIGKLSNKVGDIDKDVDTLSDELYTKKDQ